MKVRLAVPVLVALIAGALWVSPGVTAEAEARYIVTLDRSASVKAEAADAREVAGSNAVIDTFNAVKGLLVRATADEADELEAEPGVLAVEKDGIVTLAVTQQGPPWGLDRIDQRNRPLSNTYEYTATGAGVTAYIIDTGIHATHNDFGGRVVAGTNTVDPSIPPTTDCNGHGTHTAGTVGGATYGVAKAVTLVAVRVFGCENSTATSDIIEGVDWVSGHHQAGVPAVANMSVGGPASTALDSAVARMITDGVSTAVSSGNESATACNKSPARVATALTTGATDINDARASFSNFGTCVDIHAPGVGVVSASPASNTATASLSGTSMAAPHVAGAAALHLQNNPSASPAAVHSAIVSNASTGKISGIATTCNFIQNLLGTCTAGTPNRLLYTGPPTPPPSSPPASAPCPPLQQLLGNC